MKYFYIEYTMFFDDDYDECDSTIIEAISKKEAEKQLLKDTVDEGYNKIEIDTIYETSSDARSG